MLAASFFGPSSLLTRQTLSGTNEILDLDGQDDEAISTELEILFPCCATCDGCPHDAAAHPSPAGSQLLAPPMTSCLMSRHDAAAAQNLASTY